MRLILLQSLYKIQLQLRRSAHRKAREIFEKPENYSGSTATEEVDTEVFRGCFLMPRIFGIIVRPQTHRKDDGLAIKTSTTAVTLSCSPPFPFHFQFVPRHLSVLPSSSEANKKLERDKRTREEFTADLENSVLLFSLFRLSFPFDFLPRVVVKAFMTCSRILHASLILVLTKSAKISVLE